MLRWWWLYNGTTYHSYYWPDLLSNTQWWSYLNCVFFSWLSRKNSWSGPIKRISSLKSWNVSLVESHSTVSCLRILHLKMMEYSQQSEQEIPTPRRVNYLQFYPQTSSVQHLADFHFYLQLLSIRWERLIAYKDLSKRTSSLTWNWSWYCHVSEYLICMIKY